MKRKETIISACVLILLCVALAAFYAIAYPAHIRWQEQNRIFLNADHWIGSYFDKPAWLGCLVGEWLTQWFSHPVVGAIILSVALCLCVVCFAIAARRVLPGWGAWLLSAAFALLMIGCSMPAATSLALFICITGGLALGFARLQFSISRSKGERRTLDLTPLVVALAYWLFGGAALLTALLITAFSIKEGRKRGKMMVPVAVAACSLGIAFAMPAILCRSYNLPYAKALVYPPVVAPALPNFDYEERLAVADAFYAGDYDRTKRLALTAANPGDIQAFYYYLSSALQDSLPDNLLKYPNRYLGTLTTIGTDSPLPVINLMNDLYYNLGDMTYAERAAMMRNVFSPGNRNVRMMQRLAEINLVSGDTLAALKYLRLLDKTSLYSVWSNARKPGSMSPEVERDILRRRAISNQKDNLRIGDNCRNIILELLESNPHNTMALDYLLCTDLLLKDMDTFKMDYDTYCMQKGSPRYKKLYQEALMIYLAGTNAPQEVWERYIVAGDVMAAFQRYSAQRGNPAFNDTYWYYFDRQ